MTLSVSKLQTLVISILIFLGMSFSSHAAEQSEANAALSEAVKAFNALSACANHLGASNNDLQISTEGHPSSEQLLVIYQNKINNLNAKKSNLSADKLKTFDSCHKKQIDNASGRYDQNNEQVTCDQAVKDMNSSLSEMIGSCESARMGSGYGKCLEQARRCRSCDPDDTETYGRSECNEETVGEVEAYAQGVQQVLLNGQMQSTSAIPNLQQSMKTFSRCPALASEDLDELREEEKDIKKERSDLMKKLREQQNSANDIVEEQEEAEELMQKELDQLDKEITQAIQDLKNKTKGIGEEAKTLVFETKAKIETAEQAIRMLQLEKRKATQEYNDEKAKAEINCHDAALKKVTQINDERKELIKASLYSAGGFNRLLQGAGLSYEEKMRRKVNEFYRSCKKNLGFEKSMISLKQNLNEKLAGIEEQIRSQKQYILSEKSKLSEIDASKLSQLETLYEEAANSKNELEKEYIRAQQRMAKTKEKFARRLLNKQNEIAQTETELREKEVYLQQKQAYLSLKQMHSAGLSSKQGAKAEAVKDIMSASGDVGTVISACKCAEGEDSWLSGTGCKKACAFDDDYNVGSDEKSCGKKRSSPRRSTGGAKKTS